MRVFEVFRRSPVVVVAIAAAERQVPAMSSRQVTR
jgi:hypothetical protein